MSVITKNLDVINPYRESPDNWEYKCGLTDYDVTRHVIFPISIFFFRKNFACTSSRLSDCLASLFVWIIIPKPSIALLLDDKN